VCGAYPRTLLVSDGTHQADHVSLWIAKAGDVTHTWNLSYREHNLRAASDCLIQD
jgi:hypothetical protein